ncbi:hypothetical protein CcrRB23_gp401 [Caulobacter phage RB23]|nr:hypothetical protein CcrRB23_gp401 [Caulobacter phage RB23]
MTDKLLDFDYLRASGAQPHNFGLGFIQLKLNEHSRLHFWTGEPNVPEDEIHDHRYSFRSEVLKGCVEHETFVFRPLMDSLLRGGVAAEGAIWTMTIVSCDPDKLVRDPHHTFGTVEKTGEYHLAENSSYWFPYGAFHRSRGSKGAITHLVRDPTVNEYARVIRRQGAVEICPFSDPRPPEALWETIKEFLAA